MNLKEWRGSIKLLLGIAEPFANTDSQKLWLLALSTAVNQEWGEELVEPHFLLQNGWLWTVPRRGIIIIFTFQRADHIEGPC